MQQGLLTTRLRRRLAWLGFLVLAAYAPVVSWLTRDDSYLMPLTVAGMVGYAIIVDDVLRRRAAAVPARVQAPETPTTQGRPVDGPESVSESDQRER